MLLILALHPTGLKHVSDDQKTHKNASLRQSQAALTKTKSSERVTAPKAPPPKKAPLLELEGKKWRVVRGLSLVSGDGSSRVVVSSRMLAQNVDVVCSCLS